MEQKHIDPTALGLFGLALVTLISSTEKLGLSTGVTFILPWAIFLGGIAQLIAGIYDFKKQNVLGGTAFIGYGLFWLAVAFAWISTFGVFGEAATKAINGNQIGFAFLGYLIFSMFMTVGASETNKVLFFIFVFIDCLFLGLTLTTFGIAPKATLAFAGYSELIVSILSFYGSGASLLKNHFGQEIMPIGKPFGFIKKACTNSD